MTQTPDMQHLVAGLPCAGTLLCVRQALQNNGRLSARISLEHLEYVLDKVPSRGRPLLQAALDSLWYRGHMLLRHRMDRSRAHLRRIDATVRKCAGHVHIELDLPKLLCLHGKDPLAQLRELEALLTWVATEMAARPAARCLAKFMNNRDHGGKVYGDVHFNADASEEGGSDDTHALSQAFKARIAQSPALQGFAREVALSLGKLGPWSWAPLSEAEFFEEHQGPHTRFIHAKVQAKRAAKGRND